MRCTVVAALVVAPFLSSCDHGPRLDGGSLLALHQSTQAMKRELRLSKKDAAALDGAVDVLVGDATRELVAAAEKAGESPTAPPVEADASGLAPVDGLSFEEVIRAATDVTKRELDQLVAELAEREAVAAEHQGHLDRIEVVRANYGMSLASRRSWIDLAVRNGTDKVLTEVLLDCRLVDRAASLTREQGTCAVPFPDGIDPGATAIGQSYVGWETEPRSSRVVEAWPIRAYGAHRAVLWEVPSRLDPLEEGEIGDIKSRVAVVDSSLRRFTGVELQAQN